MSGVGFDFYRKLGRSVAASRDFGEPLVEHEINENTSDGNIEPEGKCPASPSAVALETTPDRVGHGRKDERHDDNGQNDVRDEHSVVEGLPESFSAKRGVHTLHQNFVQHVGYEEDARNGEGPNHASPMRYLAFGLDEDKASEEEESGNGIEAGIECGQVGNAHGTLFARSRLRQVFAM